MTDSYCRSCFRTLPPGREVCAMCDQQIAGAARSRIALVLCGLAIPFLIGGVLTLNMRFCAIGAAVAALGVVLRLVRL